MDHIALTLGHNSSAILIRGGEIIVGYEEERFTLNKAESSFPYHSLMEINKRHGIKDRCNFYISHWFMDFKLKNDKYYDRGFLERISKHCKIKTLNEEFTHHDAHMISSEVFIGKDFPENHYTIVCDGFGSEGECISVYHMGHLVHRVKGFENSIGLFYQYATDFCGMKMNNHEYKMLGYETKIEEVCHRYGYGLHFIDSFINAFSYRFTKKECRRREYFIDDLSSVKENVQDVLQDFLTSLGFNGPNEDLKVLISYFAQKHVENVLLTMVKTLDPENLVLVGGVFYNVKLNHLLCNETKCKFSVMPLSGDQGAGLGVYEYYNKDLKWPNNLFWGERDIKTTANIYDKDLFYSNCFIESLEILCAALEDNVIINLIRGDMEFGPRSLCNTSTLAIPSIKNKMKINKLNSRTDAMPFALVMTEYQAKDLLEDTEKVHKSLEYMIMARTVKEGKHLRIEGGCHYYPKENKYTCRPQITKDPLMIDILNEFGPLINTSFNFHGVPIARGEDSILHTHFKQKSHSDGIKFSTLIFD